MTTRYFAAIIGLDEGMASRYDEINGHDETAPGDFLEREFKWLEPSGLSLDGWALLDDDVPRERYLLELTQFAIDHNSDADEGTPPPKYGVYTARDEARWLADSAKVISTVNRNYEKTMRQRRLQIRRPAAPAT